MLKEEFLKGDGQDSFRIANKLNLRHRRTDRRTYYAPEFLEWLFYWYLATVDLPDKLLGRRQPKVSQYSSRKSPVVTLAACSTRLAGITVLHRMRLRRPT